MKFFQSKDHFAMLFVYFRANICNMRKKTLMESNTITPFKLSPSFQAAAAGVAFAPSSFEGPPARCRPWRFRGTWHRHHPCLGAPKALFVGKLASSPHRLHLG
eukprot:TRINITY_DN9834_c0_g1_i2.p1 TRINITY_DN9834_c0_g1~~TRINITY_DN9834_c0_g1_i2.p1  ORF type:complete len:103 (-),score=0.07 TRINITY_DN9834_c0_g1_i2:166-474(-)